jgi:hypothetical protein
MDGMEKYIEASMILARFGIEETPEELRLFFAAGDEEALYLATAFELAHEYAEFGGKDIGKESE